MKKSLILLSFVLCLPLMYFGCEENKFQDPSLTNKEIDARLGNGPFCTADLVAGQDQVIGYVSLFWVYDQMKIVYVIENQDFCLLETHLDVQGDPSLFPQTKKGNPKPGHFAFGEEDLDCVYSWSTGIVDLPESFTPGNPIYIAAHAVVLEYVSYDPVIINTETAWAGDEDFPGKNWAAYFMCQ